MTTGSGVAASCHGDNVYPYHFSTQFAWRHITNPCMLTGSHVDFKQLDFHMCFLALLRISHSFFFSPFVGRDYHFPLTVIPPVLENNVPLCLKSVSTLMSSFSNNTSSIAYPRVCVSARDLALASDWCVGENRI